MKCPKCKEKIKYLEGYAEQRWIVELDKRGELKYKEIGEIDTPDTFECPICNEEIFDNEEEAVKFLKGGKRK